MIFKSLALLFVVLATIPGLGQQAGPAARPSLLVQGMVLNQKRIPLPNARVTIPTFGNGLTWSDTDGTFALAAFVKGGDPIILHIELEGYGAIDQKAIASDKVQTTVFLSAKIIPTDHETKGAILGYSNMADKITNGLGNLTPVHGPDYVQAQDKGDKIVFYQGSREDGSISESDLSRLDGESKRLIVTLETDMQRNFDSWNTLYLKQNAPDSAPGDDAQFVKAQDNMCMDLNKILDFLTQLNIRLLDHYSGVRMVCNRPVSGRHP
jgi:hypothetical protein